MRNRAEFTGRVGQFSSKLNLCLFERVAEASIGHSWIVTKSQETKSGLSH